jgi:hypothetical protein
MKAIIRLAFYGIWFKKYLNREKHGIQKGEKHPWNPLLKRITFTPETSGIMILFKIL